MLKKCPECQLPVSDKALACPHCGYPMHGLAVTKRRSQTKRKRLPNGFGQISEIKGHNLRKPFRAMVTVDKDTNGRPICKPLKPDSYFETYNDAYAALVEYNKNPYDLSPSMTVQELYDQWSEAYFKTLHSDSSVRSITSSWAYCGSISKMRASDVRARHIKGVLETGYKIVDGKEVYPSAGVKARMKSMLNIMFDYAVEYELTDKNYARTFAVPDSIMEECAQTYHGHMAFTDAEMQTLEENITYPWADVLLFQCYSGWRPQELGLIELANINLSDWTIVGGMKTEAGRNRVVPIHEKMRPIVLSHYTTATELHSKYLFNCTDADSHSTGLKLTYSKYQTRFTKVIEALHLNKEHRPHDGRKHFVTMAKKYKVDDYAIKYIIGHHIQDITEKIYTERNIEWLHTELAKIK